MKGGDNAGRFVRADGVSFKSLLRKLRESFRSRSSRESFLKLAGPTGLSLMGAGRSIVEVRKADRERKRHRGRAKHDSGELLAPSHLRMHGKIRIASASTPVKRCSKKRATGIEPVTPPWKRGI